MLRILLLSVMIALGATPAMADMMIEPGPDAQERLIEALVLAQPGDVIELAEGEFRLTGGLALDADNVTILGQGMDRTILSFAGQTGGSEGILVTGDGAILKDFAVVDTRGDAIKSKGVDGIAFVRVRAEWTGGPDQTNGAYGLYPVQSKNVLIDGCVAIGASDAGIYVGQSERIIVRNSRAEFNVAGLEIENSSFADVHDNVLTRNTGGLLVFDLPNLPVQGGHSIRVFRNRSFDNDTDNFAPAGNIVGMVPRGTGLILMATADVEVFENEFHGNDTANVLVGSYAEPFDDPVYRPHPRRIHIHGNKFGISGENPDDRDLGSLLEGALGLPIPDIVWDGVMPLSRYFLWGQPEDEKLAIHGNTHERDRDFANADLIMYYLASFLHRPEFDARPYDKTYPSLEPVTVTLRGEDVDNLEL